MMALHERMVQGMVAAYLAIDSALSQSLTAAQFIQSYTRIMDRDPITKRMHVRPYSFEKYPSMIQIVNDSHPRQVITKPSQKGVSTALLRRELYWLVSHPGSSTIYTIPNHEELTKFVSVHCETCIDYSPILRSHFIGDRDSTQQKSFKVGDAVSFLHFQGRSTETSVRMIPADSVIIDEAVLGIPKLARELTSRVDNSPYQRGPYKGRVTSVSTPLFPNSPLSLDYEASDQHVFMVKCPRCNEYQEILYPRNIHPFWEPGEKPPRDEPEYRCYKRDCHKILNPREIIEFDPKTLKLKNAQWVPTYPSRTKEDTGTRGYLVPFAI
jgi:phage terminase large subunit GpA-like protein